MMPLDPPANAWLLLAALAMDLCAGEPFGPLARLPHPIRWIGKLISMLDQRLNRQERSRRDRRIRGALVVVLVLLATGAAGALITVLCRLVPFGWIVELVCVVTLLAQRSLYRHVAAVADGLDRFGLEGGRAAVGHIVGRDPSRLDRHGVARAAIESCAENFSDAVVAPTVWYLLLGLPGLLMYKAANTMDSMIGYRTTRYEDFGAAAAKLDDLLNLAPSRLAGLLIAVAAVAVPSASPTAAWRTMLRDARSHRSPNAGWPEAAIAGALGLALAGPRRYAQITVDDPWIGNGTAQAEAQDVRRSLAVYVWACIGNAVLVAVIGTIAALL